MKDKLQFGTIGLLVGIIVMQWMMPDGRADVVGPPVGNVVAAEGNTVLTVDGGVWLFRMGDQPSWERLGEAPIPVGQVRYFGSVAIVATNGDLWERGSTGTWVNRGQPPISPVSSEQSTWGKIKATFSKGEKP